MSSSSTARLPQAPANNLDEEGLSSDTLFDSVTQHCDAFRILVAGKSGSGKSSLVSKVFGCKLDNPSNSVVSDFTVGEHLIDVPITSSENRSLKLHDSNGLESGSKENLDIITNFIERRRGMSIEDQLHAIWYCVEVPLSGQRTFEAGEIQLFKNLLDSGNKVPVIVVFTKVDCLEYQIKCQIRRKYKNSGKDSQHTKEKFREEYKTDTVASIEKSCIEVLKSKVPQVWAKYCLTSITDSKSIIDLVEHTKNTLADSEALNILWASAQMADVDLKVSTSIQAGRNMYWRGLSAAMIPLKGIRRLSLLTVLRRIHSDIVRIWNIQDPEEILIGANMRTMIRRLFMDPTLAPMLDGSSSPDGGLSHVIDFAVQSAANPAAMVVPAANEALKAIDNIVTTTPATARVLMAYIADLTLGMEDLYWLLQRRDNKSVDRLDISNAFKTYQVSQQSNVHSSIRDYCGDENIMRPFQREKTLQKVSNIVTNNRFDPSS